MPRHSSPTLPLAGRVALVTGANHGIGAATAISLSERGADVAVAYLRTTDPEQSDDYNRARASDGGPTVAAIEAAGRRAVAIEADLADPHAPSALFDAVEAALGAVEVLVHNASGWRQDSFAAAGVDGLERSSGAVAPSTVALPFAVDAMAGALLMADFITRHRARGATWGRIVTLTSGGRDGFPGEVSYGAAKSALVSYTLSAAAEMAADGVTANVVHPPVTDTGWVTDAVREFVARDTEHHHVASPAEVAAVIAWLCADAGRVVTGNVIRLR